MRCWWFLAWIFEECRLTGAGGKFRRQLLAVALSVVFASVGTALLYFLIK